MRHAVTGRPIRILLAGVALCCLLAFTQEHAAAASSEGVTRECQHPLTTGQEAINIRHVNPKTACKTVRALARFISNGTNSRRLYKCVGTHGGHTAGRPVLEIHRFDGWRLKVVHTYGFQMSRGRGSFEVTGTDFPLNCS
jgi:hypothetical protein